MAIYVCTCWLALDQTNLEECSFYQEMRLQNIRKGNRDKQWWVGCRDLHFLAHIKIILRITSFFSLKKMFFLKVSPRALIEASLEVSYTNCWLSSFCYRLTDHRGDVFLPLLNPAQTPWAPWLPLCNGWHKLGNTFEQVWLIPARMQTE